jgi:hypothetical protein
VYGCRLHVGSITSADENEKDFVISITMTEAEVGSSKLLSFCKVCCFAAINGTFEMQIFISLCSYIC